MSLKHKLSPYTGLPVYDFYYTDQNGVEHFALSWSRDPSKGFATVRASAKHHGVVIKKIRCEPKMTEEK